jgi:hypothetical protein
MRQKTGVNLAVILLEGDMCHEKIYYVQITGPGDAQCFFVFLRRSETPVYVGILCELEEKES